MSAKRMYHRHIGFTKSFREFRRQGRRRNDDAINGILTQHSDRLFRVRFIRQIDQQRTQPAILQPACKKIKDFKKYRVMEIVRHQADQSRASGRQTRCQRIGCIAEFFGSSLNTLTHLFRYRRAVGEGSGYCRRRDTRSISNIL